VRVERTCAAVVAMAMTLAVGRQAVAAKIPDGYGKAKFGMSELEVKNVFPKMEKLTPAGAGQPVIPLVVYQLQDQTVGTLKQCTVELRFFETKFYEVQCRCPDKEKVTAYLQKTYGSALRVEAQSMLWTGDKVGIQHVPGSGAFAIDDLERSKRLSLTLLAIVMQHQQPAGDTPAAPPQAAPPPNQPAQ